MELYVKCFEGWGGRESSCSKTDVSAILTICPGRFDLGRGTCERHVSPLTGGTLTTELTYTYNDYGLPVKEGAKWRNTRGLGSVTQ